METQTIYTTLVAVTCCHKDCGVTFGINEGHHKSLRKSHAWFCCPNGHQQHFAGETEEEKLRRQLTYMEQSRDMYKDRHESAENSNRALRGVITRTKRRIAHGVCPCCKRTFQNVARHMDNKHPEYKKETE